MIMLLMLARVKGVSGPARFLNVNNTVPGQSMIFVLYNKYSSNYTVLG